MYVFGNNRLMFKEFSFRRNTYMYFTPRIVVKIVPPNLKRKIGSQLTAQTSQSYSRYFMHVVTSRGVWGYCTEYFVFYKIYFFHSFTRIRTADNRSSNICERGRTGTCQLHVWLLSASRYNRMVRRFRTTGGKIIFIDIFMLTEKN